MRVLLHARLPELIAVCTDRFRRLGVEHDVADSLQAGLQHMRSRSYDRIFVGYGVSAVDRLAIVAEAGHQRCGITELLDRDTIYKVLHVRSLSTAMRVAQPG